MTFMKKESFLFDAVLRFAGTVQIAELLTEIEAVIKKHVVLNDHADSSGDTLSATGSG